jgi:hypothetical protein
MEIICEIWNSIHKEPKIKRYADSPVLTASSEDVLQMAAKHLDKGAKICNMNISKGKNKSNRNLWK